MSRSLVADLHAGYDVIAKHGRTSGLWAVNETQKSIKMEWRIKIDLIFMRGFCSIKNLMQVSKLKTPHLKHELLRRVKMSQFPLNMPTLN